MICFQVTERCVLHNRRLLLIISRHPGFLRRCLSRDVLPRSPTEIRAFVTQPNSIASASGEPCPRCPASTVGLEEAVLGPLNKWLCQVFDRKSMDRTVAALVASQGGETNRPDVATAKKRLADAEAKLRRFQDAIAAGVDPAAIVSAINEAEEIRAAASAELKGFRAPHLITEAQAQVRLDMLDDVTEVISEGKPERLVRLFDQLGIALRYEKAEEAVYVTTSPRVLSERVREGT